ncbi:nucleotidyltransferase domain-containing protein [Sulfurovum sp.]|uniref:nucleotidyltransferase family protein n=1 Tax=Sulfurovum sp. TaxID=1969726 RepID=UPI0025D79496|nr:nucleotidyltransferase domain-containing protein [Sulfurovum sp.]
MLSKDKILETLHAYKEMHKEQYGIEQIGLFGSYAKDRATEESDVDVFISLRHSNLFLLSRIRIELEELLGISTDIVQIRERMNTYLKKQIEQEAISA